MNALQVYFGDKLVGAFENAPCNTKEVPAEIPIMMVTDSIRKHGPDAGEMNQMIWIPTARRAIRIDKSEMGRMSDITGLDLGDPMFAKPALFAKYFGIPSYAERTRLVEQNAVQFDWYVMAPTLSQYETLFDLDNFKPL